MSAPPPIKNPGSTPGSLFTVCLLRFTEIHLNNIWTKIDFCLESISN